MGLFTAYSQQIIPAQTTEQCPGVNITCTVTIAAQSIQNVLPKALNVNPTVVQQPFNVSSSGGNITFSFVGSFADYNNKQTFTVYYTNSSSQAVTWDATFVKIKSLLTANSFSQIYPSPTSITAQRCQTQNFNISFSNIQYGNPFEAPAIGYGTVTNYEYLLPTGWVLNGTTSNGSNWIAGNNNVTVTSDLSTGVNGAIRIRPVNTACGSGLQSGQEATVAILRPAPTVITGGQTLLCSGTSTYTLDVIPPGATVCWTLSNNTVASIPTSPFCGNSVTVTRIGSGNANTVLTATVSDCSGTYPPINFTIAVGTPGSASLQVNESAFDFCNTGLMQFDATLENPSPTTSLQWSVSGSGARMKYSATGYTPVLQINTSGTFEILGELSNSCGTSNYSSGILNSADFWSSYCGSYRFSVSPNPVKGNMNVIFDKPVKANESIIMKLYAIYSSMIVKQWNLKGGQKQYSLNKSDLKSGQYVLEVAIGNVKVSKQVIIE